MASNYGGSSWAALGSAPRGATGTDYGRQSGYTAGRQSGYGGGYRDIIDSLQGTSPSGGYGAGQNALGWASPLPPGGVYGQQKWAGGNGIDIFVPRGTPIYAPFDGEVGPNPMSIPSPFGPVPSFLLRGSNGMAFQAAHAQLTARGRVRKGQQIGVVGDPGMDMLGPYQGMPDGFQHLDMTVGHGSGPFPITGGDINASQFLRQTGYQGRQVPGVTRGPGGGGGMGGMGGGPMGMMGGGPMGMMGGIMPGGGMGGMMGGMMPGGGMGGMMGGGMPPGMMGGGMMGGLGGMMGGPPLGMPPMGMLGMGGGMMGGMPPGMMGMGGLGPGLMGLFGRR